MELYLFTLLIKNTIITNAKMSVYCKCKYSLCQKSLSSFYLADDTRKIDDQFVYFTIISIRNYHFFLMKISNYYVSIGRFTSEVLVFT